jgi:heat shock protein HslJ
MTSDRMPKRDNPAWAERTWRYCRQLALPRSGIVVALGVLAIIVWLSDHTFPVNQQYEVYAINGRLLPVFLEPDGRVIPKYRPTLRVTSTLFGETRVMVGSPCNPWSSSFWWLRSGLLVFGSAYQTAKGCPSDAAMKIETDFDAAIARVTRWRLERAELILEGDGVEIRLAPSMGGAARK